MHASSLGQTGLSDPASRSESLESGHVRTPVGPRTLLATDPESTRRSWLPVGLRIGAGFGVALLLLALLSMGVNSRLSASQQERRWAQHAQEVLSKNEQVLSYVRQAEGAARGYRLTEAPVFREQFDAALIDVERAMAELRTLTADNPTQQQLIATLIPVVRQRLETVRQLFDPRRTDAEAIVLSGSSIMDRVDRLTAAIHREDSRLLEERRARARAAETLTRQVSTYGSLIAVLLIALVGWLVTRSILRPVAAI